MHACIHTQTCNTNTQIHTLTIKQHTHKQAFKHANTYIHSETNTFAYLHARAFTHNSAMTARA